MACSPAYDSLRLVGDPVDVVTGACVEVSWEFQLRGPVPFVFRRHYDSAKRALDLPIGWGHSHEYDRSLAFDVDGFMYTAQVSRRVAFPPLLEDGAEAVARGLRLVRVGALQYELSDSDGTIADFTFDSPHTAAPIQRLRRGRDSIRFTYDPYGRLAAVTDSLGRYLRIETDASGRLLALVLIGNAGRNEKPLMRFSYNSAGHLATGADAHGHTFSFEYDHLGRLIRKTDRRGYSFIYEYDDDDRCVHSTGSDGLHDVRLRYLPEQQTTIVTRADGGEWTYLYDEQGTVTRIIDPYGGARSFEVDEQGRVAREIDPNGNAFDWVYGTNGAKLGKRSPFGELLRDAELPAVPTARAHRIPRSPLEFEFGNLLRPDRILPLRPGDPALSDLPVRLRRALWTIPARGSPKSENADERIEGSRTFDQQGLRILQHKPGFKPRRWLYDTGANTRSYHDHDGSIHAFEYGSWDLRTAHIDPVGGTTRLTYTAAGKIASITDPGGTRSEYAYDLKDRLSTVHRHGELRDVYRYDEADNLVEKVDRNGEWLLRFEIGPGNAKVGRHLATGGQHTFEYDDRGRYIKACTPEFDVTFEYDELGQRSADLRDGLGVRHRFRGPRELQRTTVFDTFNTTYRRASDGSLRIADPTGREHRIEFLGAGLVRRILSNGTRETVQFDSDGRCRLRHRENAAHRIIATQAYHYSGEGDLLEARDDRKGITRYAYDAAHRLQTISNPDGTIARYRFDRAGNLLEQPGLRDARIASGNRLGHANTEMFEYNHRNHMAVRRSANSTTHYEYDSRDMLVRVRASGMEWVAAYDPLGRRIRTAADDREKTFYWDNDRLAAELVNNGRLRIYLYPDSFAIVPMMFVDYPSIDADARNGRLYFVFCNHMATPVRVENEDGEPVWNVDIEPFGFADISQQALADFPFRLPGHYYDLETGLHYNRFRYYDPVLGRYVQSDPAGLGGGSNVYAYAVPNPLREADPRGECGSGATDGNGDGEGPEDPKDMEGTPRDGGDPKPLPVPLDEAIATVRDALDAASVGLGPVKAIGVSTHEDGTVTVALSGSDKSVQSAQNRMELPDNYNHAPAAANVDHFDPPPPDAAGNQYRGDSSTCVEPRQAAGEAENPSPVVERTDNPVWRGDPDNNPYPVTDSDGNANGRRMEPCPSCDHNSERMGDTRRR